MAIVEHLNKLKDGIVAWNEWRKEIERNTNDDEIFDDDLDNHPKVDLTGANLAHLHLANAELADVDLSGANLRQSNARSCFRRYTNRCDYIRWFLWE